MLSFVWLFVTPWTVAHQTPLSMGFSRQGYWSGLPFPTPGTGGKAKVLTVFFKALHDLLQPLIPHSPDPSPDFALRRQPCLLFADTQIHLHTLLPWSPGFNIPLLRHLPLRYSLITSSSSICSKSIFQVAQTVKNLPAMCKTWVQYLGWKDLPEECMAAHCSILA